MANNVSDLALDGNTAVRLLQDLFVADITLAQIRCEACNAVQGVGSLATYGTPMGAVLRCSCLCQHSNKGGPYSARPVARNDGRSLPQIPISARVVQTWGKRPENLLIHEKRAGRTPNNLRKPGISSRTSRDRVELRPV